MTRRLVLLAALLGGGCFSEPPPSVFSPDDDEAATDDGSPITKGDEHGEISESADPTDDPGLTTDDILPSTSGDTDSETGDSVGDTDPGDESSSGTTTSETGEESSGSSSTGDDTLYVDDLNPGEIVITELMWNPNCGFDDCEWTELYNATDYPVDLLGLLIQDRDRSSANQGRVNESVVVMPGEYIVLALTDSGWPYLFEPATLYGPAPQLTNGSPDQLVILNNEQVIDETATHLFDAEQGVSWAFDPDVTPDATLNDNAANWCDSASPLPVVAGPPEHGTPGGPNDCV